MCRPGRPPFAASVKGGANNEVNQDLGEIRGVFVSKQPSDTGMGSKAPKTILLTSIFYGKAV